MSGNSISDIKGVILLLSASRLDYKAIPFSSISWADFSYGTITDIGGQSSTFADKDVAAIVYFDAGYYDQIDGAQETKAYRAGLQVKETVANTNFLNLVTSDDLKSLQSSESNLKNLVEGYPKTRVLIQSQIDILKSDINRFSNNERMVASHWMTQDEALAAQTPAVVGGGSGSATFTTKDGKKYINAKVSVTDTGVSVLTSDGGTTIPFDQLPDDLSSFSKGLQQQIAKMRQNRIPTPADNQTPLTSAPSSVSTTNQDVTPPQSFNANGASSMDDLPSGLAVIRYTMPTGLAPHDISNAEIKINPVQAGTTIIPIAITGVCFVIRLQGFLIMQNQLSAGSSGSHRNQTTSAQSGLDGDMQIGKTSRGDYILGLGDSNSPVEYSEKSRSWTGTGLIPIKNTNYSQLVADSLTNQSKALNPIASASTTASPVGGDQSGDSILDNLIARQELTKEQAVSIAISCATTVLPIFEKRYTLDKRARQAIGAAQGWLDAPSVQTKNIAQGTGTEAYAAYREYAEANAAAQPGDPNVSNDTAGQPALDDDACSALFSAADAAQCAAAAGDATERDKSRAADVAAFIRAGDTAGAERVGNDAGSMNLAKDLTNICYDSARGALKAALNTASNDAQRASLNKEFADLIQSIRGGGSAPLIVAPSSDAGVSANVPNTPAPNGNIGSASLSNLTKDEQDELASLTKSYGKYWDVVIKRKLSGKDFPGLVTDQTEAYEVMVTGLSETQYRRRDPATGLPAEQPGLNIGIAIRNSMSQPTQAVLVTTQTSFQSSGNAEVLAKKSDPVDVTMDDGFAQKIPVLLEVPSDPKTENRIQDLLDKARRK